MSISVKCTTMIICKRCTWENFIFHHNIDYWWTPKIL